jgi:tetratricopeptide (TPR) repeat protein
MNYFTTIILFLFSCAAFAHGDLDVQIKKVTKQIEKSPDNPELYIKRGQLYYQHEEYKYAIIDYERARVLGLESIELDILFAQAYYSADKRPIAQDYLTSVLEKNPDHVIANRLLGAIYIDLLQYEVGSQALEKALMFSQKKLPEHYVQLADAYKAMRSEDADQKAIQTLKSGIQELGNLPVFLNRLVQLYKNNGQYSESIDIQTQVINISKRKELPFLNRAKLYMLAKNIPAANADLANARQAISTLPKRLQRSDHISKLTEEINSIEYDISN